MVTLPIPRSTGEKLVSFFSGSAGLLLWRVFLIAALVFLMFLLVAGGGFIGIAIAGLLLTTLIRDEVRSALSDLWHFRFWRVG